MTTSPPAAVGTAPAMIPDRQLTVHFSLHEMLFSQTAVRYRYNEQFMPPASIVDNLQALCREVLQPLRTGLNRPLKVSSGYRCPRLNKKIGGATTSQHMFGEAADISVMGMSTEELFQTIRIRRLPFDQLIQEFDSWVHVSFRPNPRGEVLRAVKLANGQVKYLKA